MNHFERSFVIKKPINEVFYLLSDVDKYQNFIPFCKSSEILELQDDYIIAQLTLDFFGIENQNETFNLIFYRPIIHDEPQTLTTESDIFSFLRKLK